MKKQLFGFGRSVKMTNITCKIFLFSLVVFVLGCSVSEERPNYDGIVNEIPNSSLKIKWSQSNGFENQSEITNSLNDKNKSIFSQSISWISTESNIKLVTLNGKSARELVDFANCLKVSNLENKCVGN